MTYFKEINLTFFFQGIGIIKRKFRFFVFMFLFHFLLNQSNINLQ